MTVDLKKIESSLNPNCIVTRGLRKDGCTVSLRGVPVQRLIVDLDKPGSPLNQNQPRCDYLFVANGDGDVGWFAPLELKRGSLLASEVVRQLQAGATVAEQLVANNDPVRFRPTAAFGSIHKYQRLRLKTHDSKIHFHNQVEAVRLIRCGTPLLNALTE